MQNNWKSVFFRLMLGILWGALGIHGNLLYAADAKFSGPRNSDQVIAYAISPDGAQLAEVLRGEPDSRGIEQISIKNISEGSSRVVYVGRGIERVFWMNSQEILFSRAGAKSKIEWENILNMARGTLFKSSHSVYVAAYDRRRGLLAYAYSVPWRWRGRNSVRVSGAMTTLQLISPTWARWPARTKVGAFTILKSGEDLRSQSFPLAMRTFSVAPNLLWMKGKLIGILPSLKSWRTKMFNLETGHRVHPSVPLFRMMSFAGSRAGKLAVVSNRVSRSFGKDRCGCVGSMNVFEIGRGRSVREFSALSRGTFIEGINGMWFAKHHRMYIQVGGYARPGGVNRWRLDELNTRSDKIIREFSWPHGDLGSNADPCEFDSQRTVAVCVAQTLTDPPELVVIDLVKGTVKNLGKLDSRQHALKFNFEPIKIPSRFGYYSTGFLAVPPGSAGRRVPLAVMAYGFSERYSKNAQWITSYPVAKFVHAGIAVLLINWVNFSDRGAGLFAQSKRAQQCAVATLANAIPAVKAAGVRVSRAMVMGWSFGGLYAADAIEKLHEYVAAEVGDPADFNVTEYALGGSYWRLQSRLFFGGPPVGAGLKRYQYFDPSGSGKPANGPVLLEFVSRNPDAGQFLAEWKATGTHVEAFAYRRSIHWLSVPAEAKISRMRNLYWAELNLLGPDAVSPALLRSVGLIPPPRRAKSARYQPFKCRRRITGCLQKTKTGPRSLPR